MTYIKKRIEEAAEKYSEEQFSYGEDRTVSRYSNSETFCTAFEAGAQFGCELERKRILELLAGKYDSAAQWLGVQFLKEKIPDDKIKEAFEREKLK